MTNKNKRYTTAVSYTHLLLDFFKKHQKVVKYTVKAGGILMILMGVMMITGWMNGVTGYLSSFGGTGDSTASSESTFAVPPANSEASQTDSSAPCLLYTSLLYQSGLYR